MAEQNKTVAPKPADTKPVLQVTHVPVGDIHPSPFNRPDRSGFDEKSIAELAASIREKGILQPLVVRKNAKGFELVCGERRWTAAREAKLPTVPVLVRDCSDNEARELQIIENLQREGLHPIEEAKGYRDLLQQRDLKTGKSVYTIETLAYKLGKSVAFLYARLKLLKMPQLAQDAMYSGKLNHSIALLLCRIPDPKLQKKATFEILDPNGLVGDDEAARVRRALNPESEPMSYRRAKNHISMKYMVRLKGTPFPQEDADLVPVQITDGERIAGGKCSDCPWRTGNLKRLFPDLEATDVCTNPACFQSKKQAEWKRANDKAKAQGHTLLKDGKAREIFSDGKLESRSEFVDVKDIFPGEKKKTWEQVLGDKLPDQLVQARDDKRKVHFLIPVDHAVQAAKQVGRTVAKPKAPATSSYDPEAYRREEAERKARIAMLESVLAVALQQVTKAARGEPALAWWRWVARTVAESTSGALKLLEIKSSDAIDKMDAAECRAVLIACLFFDRPLSWQGDIEASVEDACDFYKVDLKALVAKAKADAKAEADKAKADAEKAKAAPAKPADTKADAKK